MHPDKPAPIARIFVLQGIPLPLAAAALRAIAAQHPPLDGERAHAELAALLRADFPGGYTAEAFSALAPQRRGLLMTAVHRAALAGIDQHPYAPDRPGRGGSD